MTVPETQDSVAARTLAEHNALHALLDEIANAADSSTADELQTLLDTLRAQLLTHFEGEEEEGSFFDQVLEEAPEQTHECEFLRGQHTRLLETVDELRMADPEARADPEWIQGVRAMLDELADHESRENELLTRVLDGSIQAQD